MRTFLRHLTCIACALFTSVAANAQQKPAAQLRGFSVVLVQGDQEGTSSELPAAARAAINDVKDFLPFKSYRLLDTSWTLGSNTTQEFTSRLRGDNQDYEVRISSKPEDPASVGVRFVLREGGIGSQWSTGVTHWGGGVGRTHSSSSSSSSSNSSQAYANGLQRAPGDELSKEEAKLAEYRTRLGALLQTRSETHPDVVQMRAQIAETEKRIAQLKQPAGGFPLGDWFSPYVSAHSQAPIIDTSFSMRIGETVVVGTSRVRGNKALIALLTAVPASGKE